MSSSFYKDAQFQKDPLSILATYDATSITTGALVMDGGLGVKLSAHIGEHCYVNSVNITPSLGDIVYERQEILQNNINTITPISNFFFYNNKTASFSAIISVDVNNSVNPTLTKTALWEVHGRLKPSGWTLNTRFTGEITGVNFYITDDVIGGEDVGQINYTNSNTDSTTSIRFKANTISPTGASNDAGPYNAPAPVVPLAANTEYTVTQQSNWSSNPTNVQQAIDDKANNIKNISFESTLYVSKNGDDTNGNGSISSPFLTITAALTEANNASDSEPIVINIAPGNYNESITIVKPNIYLLGCAIGPTKTVRINGSVTINPRSSTGGLYANYYTFEKLAIIGASSHVLEYTGNHTGSLFIKDCMIYTGDANVKGLVFTNTTSMKITVTECTINVADLGNSYAVHAQSGSQVIGDFFNCNIYGRSVATIRFEGSTSISWTNCYIDNATSNTIIELVGTMTAYFTKCTISSFTTNSNGINISNTTNLVLSHCIFNLPTNIAYNPLNPGSSPATTSNYVVKGSVSQGASVIYGDCLFAPVSVIGANYYWGAKSISNTINIIPYNTTFSSQA